MAKDKASFNFDPEIGIMLDQLTKEAGGNRTDAILGAIRVAYVQSDRFVLMNAYAIAGAFEEIGTSIPIVKTVKSGDYREAFKQLKSLKIMAKSKGIDTCGAIEKLENALQARI